MNILKTTGMVLGIVVLAAVVLYLLRSNPIGPIAGKALSGNELPYPLDWEVCNAQDTVAIEVRPKEPYSVTTWCFVHGGGLYIPVMDGSNKSWPQFALKNSRIRIKIGDNIYLAKATRVADMRMQSAQEATVMAKYPDYPHYRDKGLKESGEADTWLFRISRR